MSGQQSSGPWALSEVATAQDRTWQDYVRKVRDGKDSSFAEQWANFERIFAGRQAVDGPPLVWQPNSQVERSNLRALMREIGVNSYPEIHRWSVTDRVAFWSRTVERLGIVLTSPPEHVLDLSDGDIKDPRWFAGAELNIVDSCFTARPDQPAVISASEEESAGAVTTYGALERLVNQIANGLLERGWRRSEAVALYMPMTLECVACYLAVIRAGLRVVSIADSFSPEEVARRCEIGKARAIVTVDSYQRAGGTIDLYARVRQAGVANAIVISTGTKNPMLRDGDLSFDDLLSSRDTFESITCVPQDPINILFSSGTTGSPKAIPWTHLTPIKSAMDGHFHQDIHSEDVVAWPTNIGWMMGPWLIFATLINDATMALFEGAPHSKAFTRFVGEVGVTILGVVPSLVRAWRAGDLIDQNNWSRVRLFSSTGEPSNREDSLWLMSCTGYEAPIIEYLGGTEIGGGHLTGTVVQPASPSTFTTPALGVDVVLLDQAGETVKIGSTGELFLVPPSIGLSQRLLNRDHEQVYYAGCPRGPHGEVLRRHGDDIGRLAQGFFKAHGRADDTMNLGGIKVSSVEIERVVERHEAVYDAAAVGVQDKGEGPERLVVFVTLRKNVAREQLRQELQTRIGAELNPLFRLHDLVTVEALPRTASNKLMRRELRARYTGNRSPGAVIVDGI